LGGSGATLPIDPTTDGVAGSVVTLNAKFKHMDRNWIMVQDESGEHNFWIPRDMVLCFSVVYE